MYTAVRTVVYIAPVMILAASADTPAAGAPLEQIAIASGFAAITTAVLLTLIMRHRSGRSAVLTRAGGAAGRVLGMEPWAGLPFLVGTLALASGGFGVFWDISLHIDTGRDPGPLANPSHYFILIALYGLFAAGLMSCALHERAKTPSPVAITLRFGPAHPGGLSLPVGGALLISCGAFALTGFPLDDFWHRMFGQDVTLWGPTHLVMINGAILSVPVLAVLALESRRARAAARERAAAATPTTSAPTAAAARSLSPAESVVRTLLPAALLFAIAFWATEFDWGVPQFRVVWHPLLLALAGGVALTCGRLVLGRGGALRVLATYLVLRGALELAVWSFGRSVPAMPLFAVEALGVELVALLMKPERGGRALRFGAAAGLLCGTVGFAAQYAWTHVWAPVPWTPSLIAEGLPTAVLAGVAGGGLGALLGAGLRRELPPRPVRRGVGLAAAAMLIALGANALWVSNPKGLVADVTLSPVSGTERSAVATVRLSDGGRLARDAEMRTVLAWQGGRRVVRQLVEVAPGVFRTDGAVPLYGTFKTNLRIQSGRALVALPLHLPREPSIPTPGVTRPDRFRATLLADGDVMQTERRDYVPGWLWTPAALLMLAFCGLFVLGISTGLARVADGPSGRSAPGADERSAATPPRRRPGRPRRTPAPAAS
jgi:hypothetical protein